MSRAKKGLIVLLIIGGLFGYSQYAAATQIGVVVTESELLEKNSIGSTYNLQLEFNNPSLLMLNAGKTDFIISVEDKKVAEGVLEPFVLPALSKVLVEGKYQTNHSPSDEKTSPVTISGVTKYDLFFTSLSVPFIYFPPEDQAREFIHKD